MAKFVPLRNLHGLRDSTTGGRRLHGTSALRNTEAVPSRLLFTRQSSVRHHVVRSSGHVPAERDGPVRLTKRSQIPPRFLVTGAEREDVFGMPVSDDLANALDAHTARELLQRHLKTHW